MSGEKFCNNLPELIDIYANTINNMKDLTTFIIWIIKHEDAEDVKKELGSLYNLFSDLLIKIDINYEPRIKDLIKKYCMKKGD